MDTPSSQLVGQEERHPWLAYFTAAVIPVGILVALVAIVRGASVGSLVSILAVVGAAYTLQTTHVFRHWNTVSSARKLIGWSVIFCGFVSGLVLFPVLPICAILLAPIVVIGLKQRPVEQQPKIISTTPAPLEGTIVDAEVLPIGPGIELPPPPPQQQVIVPPVNAPAQQPVALQSQQEVLPSQVSPVSDEKTTDCPKCRAANNATAFFCIHCGTPLRSRPADTTPRSSGAQKPVPPSPVPAAQPPQTALSSTSWLAPYISNSVPADFHNNITVYTITLPKGEKWQPEQASAFMEHLLQTLWPARLTFQIVATEDTIVWQVLDIGNNHTPAQIIQAIRARSANSEVIASSYQPPKVTAPFERVCFFYKQQGDIIAPIKTTDDDDVKKIDPLVTLVNHLSNIPPGTKVTYTLHVVGRLSDKEQKSARERTKTLNLHWIELIDNPFYVLGKVAGRAATDQMKTDKYGEAQKIINERLRNALLNTYLGLQIDYTVTTTDVDRGGLVGLFSSLNEFASRAGFNGILPYPEDDFDKTRIYIDTEGVEQRTNTIHLTHVFTQYLEQLEKELKLPNRYRPITCGSCGRQYALGQQNCTNKDCKYHLPSPWQVVTGAMVLAPQELAVLWHLPHDEFTAPEITWIKGKKVRVPAELARNRSGVLIGENEYGGVVTPVYISDDDRRTHMSIIGKSGVGKSTLMHNLIHEDIRRGLGVAVIDPHGKLVKEVLRSSIPSGREQDVVIIDLADEDYPPPLNPLIVPGQQGEVAAGRVIAAMQTVYDFSHSPRALQALNSALAVLTVETSPTLRDVVRLFERPDYRQPIVQKAQASADEVTADFWETYEGLSSSAKEQLAQPVINRMYTFYNKPTLYPIMCHPHSIDFAQLIAARKIILISLDVDRNKIPEPEIRLMGSILISTLQTAGMKSGSSTSPLFNVYVDETQNFVTSSLSILLSEARKYGIGLIMANQFLDQLAGDTLKALKGNVGIQVAFETSDDDAREIDKLFYPEFVRGDLINLGKYKAAVRTRADGKNIPAFSINARPPIPEPPQVEGDQREAELRELSRKQYTPMSRQEVMDWLRQRYPRGGQQANQVGGGNQGGPNWNVPPNP